MRKMFLKSLLIISILLFSNSLFAGYLNYTLSSGFRSDLLEVISIQASDRAQFVASEIVGGSIDFNSIMDGDFDTSSLNKDDILNNLGTLGSVTLRNRDSSKQITLKLKITIETDKEGLLAVSETDPQYFDSLFIPKDTEKTFYSTELNDAQSNWFIEVTQPDEDKLEKLGNDAIQAGLAYGEPLPERTYIIKIELIEAGTDGPIAQDASYGELTARITQRLTTGQTNLNWPMDGSKLSLTETQALTFVWSPLAVRTGVSVKYILRVFEMETGASKESAIQGSPILEVTDLIDMYSLDYPSYAQALEIGNKYVWFIEARDLTGRLIGSGYSDLYVFEVSIPEPPKLESPLGNISAPLVMFSWSEVEGAESYHLKIGTNINMSDVIFEADYDNHLPKSLENADDLLEPYTTYYWAVQAYDKSGEELGEQSAVGSFLLERGIELIKPVDTQVLILPPDFSWTSLAGASSYLLTIADNNSFTNPQEYVSDRANYQASDEEFFTFDKTYSWKVQAYNSAGEKWGNESKVATFKSPERSVPDAYSPEGTLSMMDNIQFSWQIVNWAVRYQLLIADNNNFSDARIFEVTEPPYMYENDGFIQMDKTYFWKVIPYDEMDESYNKSSRVTQFKGKEANIPSLYSPLNETVFSLTGVQFNFENVEWATRYELFIAEDRNMNNAVKLDIQGSPYAFENDGSLLFGKEYFWKVIPYDKYDNNYNKVPVIGSFKTPPLDIPILLSPLNDQLDPYNTMIFNWNTVGWADSYKLSIADNTNFNNPIVFNENPPFSLEAGNLNYNKSYSWKVTAVDTSGIYKDVGSPVGSFFTIQAPSIQLLGPSKTEFNKDETIGFAWSPINGAVNYSLEIADNDKFTSAVSIRTEATEESYSDSSFLQPGKKYYYRIRAYASDSKELGKGSDIKAFVISAEEAVITYPDILYPLDEISELFPVLEWVKVEKATEYEVTVKNLKSNKSASAKSNENKLELKDVIEVEPGATYEWSVKAFIEGEKPVSSREKKKFILPKEKVKVLEPIDKEITDTEVTLKWNGLKYVDEYKIEVITDANKKDNYTAKEASLKISELKPGAYRFRVVGIKDGKEFSEWSEFADFKILKPTITEKVQLISPVNETIEGVQVELSWAEGPENTDKYSVVYADDPSLSNPKKTNVKGTSFILQDIKSGSYYWQVQAFDKDNKELTKPSNAASFRFVYKETTPTEDAQDTTSDIKEDPEEEVIKFIEATEVDYKEFAEFIKNFLIQNGAGNALDTMDFAEIEINGKKEKINKILLDKIISGELEIKYIQLR